jgi:hypothetical protein
MIITVSILIYRRAQCVRIAEKALVAVVVREAAATRPQHAVSKPHHNGHDQGSNVNKALISERFQVLIEL